MTVIHASEFTIHDYKDDKFMIHDYKDDYNDD